MESNVSNAKGNKENVRKPESVDWAYIQQDAFPEKYGPEQGLTCKGPCVVCDVERRVARTCDVGRCVLGDPHVFGHKGLGATRGEICPLGERCRPCGNESKDWGRGVQDEVRPRLGRQR